MKVAFWSYEKERCGISSNLAAISVASAIGYPHSIVTLENHLKHNNLGTIYKSNLPDTMVLKEPSNNYYEGCGIEGLVRKIYRGNTYQRILNSYITEIIQNHLYYIPQSGVIHNQIFELEFNECLHSILEMLEQWADLCYIDTSNQHNISSRTILELSDIIVVNLNQNPKSLDHFVNYYRSLIPKSVFVISEYSSQSPYSIKYISVKCKIPREQIVAIPYNEMFKDALHEGSVIDFISRYYNCDKDHPNYLFIRSVRKAVDVIMKAVEASLKEQQPEEALLCGLC